MMFSLCTDGYCGENANILLEHIFLSVPSALFCDYYNPQGECEWHYKPCGSPCMKTCRNPSGKCLHELQGLEGTMIMDLTIRLHKVTKENKKS